MPSEVWTKAGQVMAPPSDGDLRLMQQRSAMSVADPGPFGLFAFAIGTLVVAVVLSGFEPLTSIPAVIPMLVFVAGVGQFIAGLYAFAKSDTFTATALCSYGATNVYVGVFYWMVNAGRILGTPPELLLLGIGLFISAYISLALCFAALRMNVGLVVITASLLLGYALAAVTDVGGVAVVGHIGGYFLFLAGLAALYVGSAMLINSTWERPVLPLGSLTKA